LGFIGSACEQLRSEFELAVVREIPLAAVLPNTHRLASHEKIRLSNLSNDVFVGFSETSYPGRLQEMCRVCQMAGFTPAIRYQAETLAAALALVGIGKGVTLMLEEASHLPHPNVVFVQLYRPRPTLGSTAAYRKADERQTITDLITSCRQVISSTASAPSTRRRTAP
jgi:DNA-binding transcriptional LysR family regulator